MILEKTDIITWSLEYLSETLKTILSGDEDIILAYLYGSYSKGTPTKTSDLDIGLYIKSQSLTDAWFPVRIKNLIENTLQQHIEADVRIINNSSIKFLYEVIYKSQRLLIRDENFRVNFESRILIEWYDIRETWDQFFTKRLELLTQND